MLNIKSGKKVVVCPNICFLLSLKWPDMITPVVKFNEFPPPLGFQRGTKFLKLAKEKKIKYHET